MDGMLIIYLLIFAWLGALSFLLIRLVRTFSKLTKGVSDKDLRTILESVLSKIEVQGRLSTDLKEEIEKVRIDGLDHVQKVGLVRYNPFSETGGNQSFVLALLDAKGNGLVMTTLHSREATRVFAKPVKEAKENGYEFSKEEIQAILTAQGKKK